MPFDFEEALLETIEKDMPELPEPKKNRFIKDYRLSDYDAAIMASEKDVADYFEECAKLYSNPKTIVNWLMGDISAIASSSSFTPGCFGGRMNRALKRGSPSPIAWGLKIAGKAIRTFSSRTFIGQYPSVEKSVL